MAVAVVIILVLIVIGLIIYNLNIHKKIQAFNNINQRINNLSIVQDFMNTIGEYSTVDEKIKKINDILIKAMNLFKNKNYEILFVTGKNSYEEIKKIKFSSNIKVVPYIENMTRIMKNTDIIISRAGASTLSEIIALKIPSILIPSPYVPDNHQYKNALDLSSNNAAILIEEKDLNGNILVKTIDEILNDDEKIKDMKKNLEKLYVPKSATKIYETIRNIIDGK